MKRELMIQLLKAMYPIVRPQLAKAVDDPDSEWDEFMLEILDRIVEVL